jgi:hypothetical protein
MQVCYFFFTLRVILTNLAQFPDFPTFPTHKVIVEQSPYLSGTVHLKESAPENVLIKSALAKI